MAERKQWSDLSMAAAVNRVQRERERDGSPLQSASGKP